MTVVRIRGGRTEQAGEMTSEWGAVIGACDGMWRAACGGGFMAEVVDEEELRVETLGDRGAGKAEGGLAGRMLAARRKWVTGGGGRRLEHLRRWEIDEGREPDSRGRWRVARVVGVRRPAHRCGMQLEVQVEWAGVDVETGTAWAVEWVPVTWCTQDLKVKAREMEAKAYPAKRQADEQAGTRKSPRLAEAAAAVEEEEGQRTAGAGSSGAGAAPATEQAGHGAGGAAAEEEAVREGYQIGTAACAEALAEAVMHCGEARRHVFGSVTEAGTDVDDVLSRVQLMARRARARRQGKQLRARPSGATAAGALGTAGWLRARQEHWRDMRRWRKERAEATPGAAARERDESGLRAALAAGTLEGLRAALGAASAGVSEGWRGVEARRRVEELEAQGRLEARARAAAGGDGAREAGGAGREGRRARKRAAEEAAEGAEAPGRTERGWWRAMAEAEREEAAAREGRGQQDGEAGRMECPQGHSLTWCRRGAAEGGRALVCDGGCGAPIRRGGWWACARCDHDVCPRCYAEYVEGAEKERREEEARDEAEAAAAWQSVGLQEEDPMWSAGGLDL